MTAVCRCRNAFARALASLAAAAVLAGLFAAPAYADDPTPRAVPAARAYPRSFSTYQDVIAYATQIAADQNALDARAAALRAERDALLAALASGGTNAVRGGKLFDPDTPRGGQSVIAATAARVAQLAAQDRHLVDLGALTTPASAWRMPTEGELTQPFGPTDLWAEPSRTYNGVAYAHFHEGVDIAGPWAADVVAPARGRVVFVGMMMDGAEIVVIAHDGGVVSMYAHLDAWGHPPTVKAGDEVASGQKIGTVGLTGMTTGLHLHWAVWKNGALIDPLSLVAH